MYDIRNPDIMQRYAFLRLVASATAVLLSLSAVQTAQAESEKSQINQAIAKAARQELHKPVPDNHTVKVKKPTLLALPAPAEVALSASPKVSNSMDLPAPAQVEQAHHAAHKTTWSYYSKVLKQHAPQYGEAPQDAADFKQMTKTGHKANAVKPTKSAVRSTKTNKLKHNKKTAQHPSNQHHASHRLLTLPGPAHATGKAAQSELVAAQRVTSGDNIPAAIRIAAEQIQASESSQVVAQIKTKPMAIKTATNTNAINQVNAQQLTGSDSSAVPSSIHTVQLSASDSQKKPSAAAKDSPFSLNKSLGFKKGSRFHVNGFAQVGVSRTNAKNAAKYQIPDHGDVDNHLGFAQNSLLGLEVTGRITHNFDAVLQVVADGDDANGSTPYAVNAQWAFLRYKLNNSTQFLAGRFRVPTFLYSQTQQVGYTYPALFLPNSVYAIIPFQNTNGVSAIHSFALGSSGMVLKVQSYLGEGSSKMRLYTQGALPVVGVIPAGTIGNLKERMLIGTTVSVSNTTFTVRGSYSHAELSGDIDRFPGIGTTVNLFNNKAADFYSLGAKLNWHDFLLLAEFAHRSTSSFMASLTGFYGTFGYRFGKFLPYITYSHLATTNASALARQALTNAAQLPQDQETFGAGLTYYINANLVAKGNVTYIAPLDGTNGLFTANPGKNVLLYGLGLDAIF